MLERFFSEFLDGVQIFAILKTTIFISEFYDVFCELRTDTSNVRQQRCTGGIQIDADIIHAGLNRSIETFSKFGLIDVVLVLADTN